MKNDLKVLRVVTISDAFIHIKSQLKQFRKDNRDIVLVSDSGNLDHVIKEETDLPYRNIKISRDINILKDLTSLISLIKIIKSESPDIIHSSTPKAGIICALAGFLTNVPVRIHTFTGQRWATLSGFKKHLLKFIDTIICTLNTKVYSDSPSQNIFLIKENIVSSKNIQCIHFGSLGGIDLERFDKSKSIEKGKELEAKLKLSQDSLKLIFVGRINKDKGIEELVDAFEIIQKDSSKKIELLIVGPMEIKQNPISDQTMKKIKTNESIFLIGHLDNPEYLMAISSIHCLPSYREGFGTVVLEAASMELPTVGSDIPGLVDSIVHEKTGLLVPKKNHEALAVGLKELIEDDDKRALFSKNARAWAEENFNFPVIAKKQWEEYESLSNSVK